jgi:hypothetical protein
MTLGDCKNEIRIKLHQMTVQQRPRLCCVKNAFGTSVFSKEYCSTVSDLVLGFLRSLQTHAVIVLVLFWFLATCIFVGRFQRFGETSSTVSIFSPEEGNSMSLRRIWWKRQYATAVTTISLRHSVPHMTHTIRRTDQRHFNVGHNTYKNSQLGSFPGYI